MLYNIIIFLFITSFYYIGLKFPDIDLKMMKFGIKHRNILTHSFFLPFILFILNIQKILGIYYMLEFYITGIIIRAFSIGIILHILYDLFPKKFIGTALIQIPFLEKSFGKKMTIFWFILSSIILMIISLYFRITKLEIIIILICIILTLIFKRKEEKGFFLVAIIFILIFVFVFYFRENIFYYMNNLILLFKQTKFYE